MEEIYLLYDFILMCLQVTTLSTQVKVKNILVSESILTGWLWLEAKMVLSGPQDKITRFKFSLYRNFQ